MSSPISNVISLATKIESESRYWTGYDPKLISDLSKEVSKIEDEYGDLVRRADSNRSNNIGNISVFLIICLSILGLGFLIGYFNTKYDDAVEEAYNKISNNLSEDDLLKMGFKKTIVDNCTILVRRGY